MHCLPRVNMYIYIYIYNYKILIHHYLYIYNHMEKEVASDIASYSYKNDLILHDEESY